MGWYRIKRRVGGKPLLSFYKRKVKELENLIEQEKKGNIEIRYVDETGFSLISYTPYAWQLSKQKIQVKSQQSKRLNVLGFLTRTNQLEVYRFQKSITSDVVIACIDDFCQKIPKKTVLVIDNSPIHQNNIFWDKEKEWVEGGDSLSVPINSGYSDNLIVKAVSPLPERSRIRNILFTYLFSSTKYYRNLMAIY